MTRRIALVFVSLVLVAIGAGAALAPVAVSAAGPQPVSIRLTPTGVHARTNPSYVAGRPLAVRVDTSARSVDAAGLAATDTAGAVVRQPLVRSDAGFDGTLSLPHGGPWDVALTTTTRGTDQAEGPVRLELTDGDADRTAILLLVFAGCAILGGIVVGVAAPRVRVSPGMS